ncbi:MAG TPA: hypothetical protein VHR18_12550 [Solirubrobacterales bacterium]|jgi:hypothetical protein|nr:hypothetical protein [Solirubrobacterales bacterium]
MKMKLTLLAMAVGALVAFAAPVAQANLMWSEEGEFTVEGEFSVQNAGPTLVNGPCPVELSGSATESGTQIEGGSGGPCGTNFGFCSIEELSFSALPWAASSSTSDIVTLSNGTFTIHYTAGCAALGLPSNVSAAGTGSGTFNLETQCATAVNAEGLKLEANNAPLTVNGEACIASGPVLT